MLVRVPPKSSTERQRRFRERNPGYDARRKATHRALVQAGHERHLAEMAAAAIAAQQPTLPTPGEQLAFDWTTDVNEPRRAGFNPPIRSSNDAAG